MSSNWMPPQIPNYTIVKVLGEGGMAAVFMATHNELHAEVAIKFLKPNQSDHASADRFLQEAQLLYGSGHPNVMNVKDFGRVEGTPYMVMELATRGSLEKRAGERFSDQEVLGIARDVAEGLRYLHARGVVHRDIKPANLFCFEPGQDGGPVHGIRIGDLGIAKIISTDSNNGFTTIGAVASPHYASPEQLSAQEVDGRSDLYSLGCVLFELLEGERPYPGEDGYLRHIMFEVPIADLSEPGILSPVVSKLLAKDRTLRYQSADELIQDLERIGFQTSMPDRMNDPDAATLQYGAPIAVDDAPADQSVRDLARNQAVHGHTDPQPVRERKSTTVIAAAGLAVAVALTAAVWWKSQDRMPEFRISPAGTTLIAVSTGKKIAIEDLGELPEGTHSLAAIAPRHIGKTFQLTLPGDGDALDVSLTPLGVPSAADYVRFVLEASSFAGDASSTYVISQLQQLHRLQDAREQDKARALFQQHLALARVGDAASAIIVAECYESGLGVDADPRNALMFARQAARDGNALAEYLLARILKTIPQASDARDGAAAEASMAMMRSATAGFAPAQFELAAEAKDPVEQWNWATKAAEGGFPQAQLALADKYLAEGNDFCAQKWATRVRKFVSSLDVSAPAALQLSSQLLALTGQSTLPSQTCN